MTQPYPPHGQYPPPHGQQWPPQPPPAAPKKKRLWPWIVAAVVILLWALSSIGGKSTPATPAAKAPAAAVPAVAAPAAPAGPQTTVTDGTYQVGPDIAVGRYKTTGEGSTIGYCYWERSKDDSGELGSIISNDFFKGPGSVTVKKGEFAKLTGGCTWTKQ